MLGEIHLRSLKGTRALISSVYNNRMNHNSSVPVIEIKGEIFTHVKDRRHGTSIYVGVDGSKYLRIGQINEVKKELCLHKQLLDRGFPIASIVGEGSFDDLSYWIEESVGKTTFGERFDKEMIETGQISDKSFDQFLSIIVRFHTAQELTIERTHIDSKILAKNIGLHHLVTDLPLEREKIMKTWEKILSDLENVPVCFTHGDFLPNNILEKGVIDLEDYFFGPIGYDILNPITTPYWFPKEPVQGFQRWSWFSESQLEGYLKAVDIYGFQGDTWKIKDFFDPLFLLKAIWWTSGNGKSLHLQLWRNQRLLVLMDKYLQNESLYSYWWEKKDV